MTQISDKLAPGLEKAIKKFLFDIFRMAVAHPRVLPVALRVIANQFRAAGLRKKQEEHGLHVPPFIIFSIISQCNLKCSGCYSQVLHHAAEPALSTNKFAGALREAQDLGISMALLAGGEPLMRKDLFTVTAQFPKMLFPVFTNGTLFDDMAISALKKQRHVIPVISIEGNSTDTDVRRGEGVYKRAMQSIGKLKKAGIFCGISVTVTRQTFDVVTSNKFVSECISLGCRLFFFVEYVPVEENTNDLVLDESQRLAMTKLSDKLLSKHRALFIAFPGDEEKFGGCLAAGRGFVHINHSGGVEACPFAPYADVNINNMSLKDALSSKTLRTIRKNHDLLKENNGGCALWENRDMVKRLIDN
jgi:MoaA/NifB/PqqE/SkfB family radical SAM enzyme